MRGNPRVRRQELREANRQILTTSARIRCSAPPEVNLQVFLPFYEVNPRGRRPLYEVNPQEFRHLHEVNPHLLIALQEMNLPLWRAQTGVNPQELMRITGVSRLGLTPTIEASHRR